MNDEGGGSGGGRSLGGTAGSGCCVEYSTATVVFLLGGPGPKLVDAVVRRQINRVVFAMHLPKTSTLVVGMLYPSRNWGTKTPMWTRLEYYESCKQ